MILLDTDVLIGCLRGLPSADEWMQESSAHNFGIPSILAMELVVECRDKTELEKLHAFLRHFDVIWPEADEFERTPSSC